MGQALMWPALRTVPKASTKPAGATGTTGAQAIPVEGMAMPLRAIPLTGLIFTGVIAFLATSQVPPDTAPAPHIVLGTAAGIQAVAQGLIVRQGFPAVAADPTGFGRLLIRVVLPEILTLAAFVYAFLAINGG